MTSDLIRSGLPLSMAKQARCQHHRHGHRDSKRHALLSADKVILHQESVCDSGKDPLTGGSFSIQPFPLVGRRRQCTVVSKVVRVHFDSHHSGLGGDSDMAAFVAFGSTLALEIVDRSRTSPFHSAALFLIAPGDASVGFALSADTCNTDRRVRLPASCQSHFRPMRGSAHPADRDPD